MYAPRYLPPTRTPVEPAAMLAALGAAAPELGRPSLLLLLAQWALETGRGARCMNFNAAGIKGVPGGADGRGWTFYATTEVLGGRTVRFEAPKPERAPLITAADATPAERTTCFRAYDSIEEGAVDYLDLLRRRYASAWPHVIAGHPVEFVAALKRGRYFTAPLDGYTRTVVALVGELDRETFVPDALRRLGFCDVRAFQASAGLVVDGIAGPLTRAALERALAGA